MSINQSIDPIHSPTGILCKPIPGFSDYFAGTDGSIWSSRTRNGKPSKVWRQRVLGTDRRGTYFHLRMPLAGKIVTRYVHRLVLEAFAGPCPAGMTCCHNDGNPQNNHIDNLRWDTPLNNCFDKRRHRTMPAGSRHSNAKLNEIGVEAIRALRSIGWPTNRIAQLFDVDPLTIYNVVWGKSWVNYSLDQTADKTC